MINVIRPSNRSECAGPVLPWPFQILGTSGLTGTGMLLPITRKSLANVVFASIRRYFVQAVELFRGSLFYALAAQSCYDNYQQEIKRYGKQTFSLCFSEGAFL